jgi:hypothetical protein
LKNKSDPKEFKFVRISNFKTVYILNMFKIEKIELENYSDLKNIQIIKIFKLENSNSKNCIFLKGPSN